MTKREASIVSAYTGIMLGDFIDLHNYIEEIMGRPVLTYELGRKDIQDKIAKLSYSDFMDITVE